MSPPKRSEELLRTSRRSSSGEKEISVCAQANDRTRRDISFAYPYVVEERAVRAVEVPQQVALRPLFHDSVFARDCGIGQDEVVLRERADRDMGLLQHQLFARVPALDHFEPRLLEDERPLAWPGQHLGLVGLAPRAGLPWVGFFHSDIVS